MQISCVILASGFSERFNENKLEYKIDNKMLIEHVLEKYLDSKFNDIVVITHYKKIHDFCRELSIPSIDNKNAIDGISSSIKLGVEYYKNSYGILFSVADQPYLTVDIINKVYDRFIKTNKIIALRYENELYNPCIFPNELFDELLSLDGDVGGKKVIMNNLDKLETLDVIDKKIIFDIDYKKDIE